MRAKATPASSKASSFRYLLVQPRAIPRPETEITLHRSNPESVAFEQQSISIVALRRTFNACATPALRLSMLLQAHAGQRGTSVVR